MNINFHKNYVFIWIVVGLTIDQLRPTMITAGIIRALSISNSTINISPTLIYHDHPQVRKFFNLLDDVLILPDGALFMTAIVTTAFY